MKTNKKSKELKNGRVLNMAAAILFRKRKARALQNEHEEEEILLDNLTAKLPPKEIWEAELFLGILVLG
jgi:hypothetical protein